MSVYQNYKDYNEFKDFFENISDVLDLDSDDILECFDEILYNDYVDFVIVGADTLGSRWVSKKKENPWEIQAYLVSIFKFYDAIERDYNENVANKIKKLIQDQYKEYKYCIYVTNNDGDNFIELFNDIEVAQNKLKELENSEQPYVEDYIKEFEDKLSEKTHAFVEVEFDEYKQDFKVYLYGDKLIIDNAHQLEDGEVDEILSYLDFEKMLQDKYGITITECEKYKHDIGFTRGYHITFEKYGVEIEEDIEMNGYNSIAFMQGDQRTLKEILESNLDIDSLLEEFAEQYGYLKGE